MSETWMAGVVLIGLVFIIVCIPCVFIAVLGHGMLNKLAHFPSKTPAIQLSICGWLLLAEAVSVTLLIMFYQVFADYGGTDTKKGAKLYNSSNSVFMVVI